MRAWSTCRSRASGPILGSGFWLIASERFNPRSAKQSFGGITAAGTLGGLAGGLLAERVAAVFGLAAVLPMLAVINALSAWQIRRLAAPMDAAAATQRVADEPELSPAAPGHGLRALSNLAYLRDLAAVVALGTTGAALADYAFRAEAASTLGSGETLLRFFALYYAGVSLVTFVVQAALSRLSLERLGLGASAGTPSAALLVGGLGAIVAPGLPSIVAARGGESVFRGSLFRASYEIFYTPMEADERRAAKSIIDVGFDRLGDAAGATAVWLVLLLLAPGAAAHGDPLAGGGDGSCGARGDHAAQPRLRRVARAQPAETGGRRRPGHRHGHDDPVDHDADVDRPPPSDPFPAIC